MNRNSFGHTFLLLIGTLLATGLSSTARSAPPATDRPTDQAQQEAAQQDKSEKQSKPNWKPLQDNWKVCQFGGEGPVEIKKDLIQFQLGDPLTGVRWSGEVLRENFEIELEARRTDGFDFFCALTFPVGKDHVSLVLGGWGGGVVGISSVDGYDASENETTSFRNFENDKWYKVRARVEPNEIRCWIDDKLVAEQTRKGHEFDIRFEMDPCVPLGLASFQCDAEYRNIRVRKLTSAELQAAKPKSSPDDGS